MPWRRQTLTVLPAGPVPPNPSELLGSQHMGNLLKALSARYDYVIVDSPPLLPVTDGAVLATLTDGAILIARHGKTSRDNLEQAAHALHAVNAKLLGTVLNCIPLRARGSRTGYGYGYGYGDEPRGRRRGPRSRSVAPAPAPRDAGQRRRAANRHREANPEDFKLDLRTILESSRRTDPATPRACHRDRSDHAAGPICNRSEGHESRAMGSCPGRP